AASGKKPRLERSRVWKEAASGKKPRLERSRVWKEAAPGKKPRLERSRVSREAARGQERARGRRGVRLGAAPWAAPAIGGRRVWKEAASGKKPRLERSRLKGGCGQDWPPYITATPSPPAATRRAGCGGRIRRRSCLARRWRGRSRRRAGFRLPSPPSPASTI